MPVLYGVFADLLMVFHFGFAVFALGGGLLVLRWPRVAWGHVPAALWGIFIEWSGWICPLTPLENLLRLQAGEAGYRGDFIAHYLLPVLYPAGLTRQGQLILGALVAGVNLLIYGYVFVVRRQRQSAAQKARKTERDP